MGRFSTIWILKLCHGYLLQKIVERSKYSWVWTASSKFGWKESGGFGWFSHLGIGFFTKVLVKSLSKFLAPSESIDKEIYKSLCKTNSPKRINIRVWVMIFRTLNCFGPSKEDAITLLIPINRPSLSSCKWRSSASIFLLQLSLACWQKLFDTFHIQWVFSGCFKQNVVQILGGPKLKTQAHVLWANVVNALLVEIWFERNQRVFHEKYLSWTSRFEVASLNAST